MIFKRLSALILVCSVIFAFSSCSQSDKDENSYISENASSGFSDEISNEDFGDERSDDIVILYTNDVHCGINDNVGYAGLASYKKDMEEAYKYVTLVDCGDAVQGDYLGTLSKGEFIIDIMNEVGYSFAVVGNHEFDYGMERLSQLIEKSSAKYLACNVTYSGTGENSMKNTTPYDIVEYGDISVGYIGVSTPESISKSTPDYFMENGEFVYDFASGNNGQTLYNCVQGYVDECKDKGADYVVVLSHLGDAEESSPYTSIDLINNTNGIDAVLDGHAHNVIECREEENKDGDTVLLTSTGTKFANIGKLIIEADGDVSTSLISDYEKKDDSVSSFIEGIESQFEEEMNKVISNTDFALSIYDDEGVRLVRSREIPIGNMVADAYRIVGNADIAIVNGGGIRDSIDAGDITYGDLLAVHPFGNYLCVVEATGSEILDQLEIAYMYTESVYKENGKAVGEAGSFQQVSGIKFTVDTSIPSPVTLDENGMLVSIEGERRVKDVLVLDQSGEYVPFDENATYKLASHNYALHSGGCGYMGFADNNFIIAEGVADYQVLITYISEVNVDSLSDLYFETEGRINVK